MEVGLNLTGFQERLSKQYALLRDVRATENYPVYAIEHGFNADECMIAQRLLNESFGASSRADSKYWLVWIATAAEVGYRYDGAEYWDSFREAIPSWLDRNRDRDRIREFYREFASTYRGLTPSGPWARQFPIIAWPITQAILPRYLQRHFASHLVELSHLFVKGGKLTLDEIGDLLWDRYYGGSSRVKGFLQQKALTSRIVMALGVEDLADTVAPIEKSMLDRIASDIDSLGSIGRRLRETRRVLRDARFINSAKPGFVVQAKPQETGQLEPTAERVDLPRLVARQMDADTWALSVAIPDLASTLRQAGISIQDVEQSRMRFRSRISASGWVPGRALFSYNGDIEEPLDTYPLQEGGIFSFDRPLAAAQTALQERLKLPAHAMRLLKVRADGSALELSGRYVRTKQSYIIVSATDLPPEFVGGLGLEPLKTTANATYLWKLDVPASLDQPKIAALQSLDLGYLLGVRIDPIGLSPRWSNSNGALMLLDFEHALFRISSDVAVREFVVVLDTQTPVRVIPSPDSTTLMSLGALPVGPHRLSVSALGAATGGDISPEVILLEVRAVLPWKQTIEGKAGVALRLDPREAPIEQFLDGAAHIRILAPPRRSVKLNTLFFGVDGELFHDESLGRYMTPIADKKLSELVVLKLTAEPQRQHLERAARIEVVISLDECGCGNVSFEKDVEPVRWLRIDDRKVRLSDDTGETSLPTIERFDLDAVDVPTAVEYSQAVGGFELQGKGGLLVATLNGRSYEAIVTTTQRQLTAFHDLGIPAKVSETSHEPRILVRALKRWSGARRLMGQMSFMARRNAVRVLERTLAGVLCGEDWLISMDRVLSGKQELNDLYPRIWNSPGFGYGLATFDWQYEANERAANTEFLRLVKVYRLSVDPALCPFALRLAFSPQSIETADLQTAEAFAAVRSARALIRGAYFARFACDLRVRDSEVA